MKILLSIILFSFSILGLAQFELQEGMKIKSGKITLINQEEISFLDLIYKGNDQVHYTNSQTLLDEFLYVSSIQEVKPTNLDMVSMIADEEEMLREMSMMDTGFSSFVHKNDTIQLKNPSKGKVAVYFVRTNNTGFAINFRHFHYDKFIGKFAGVGYLRYECDPGENVFWFGASNSSYVTANFQADKIYVIETIPTIGFGYAKVSVEILDRQKPSKYKSARNRVLKVLRDSSNDKTHQQILHNQEDYRKEIENGLEIYRKRVSKEQDHLITEYQYFE